MIALSKSLFEKGQVRAVEEPKVQVLTLQIRDFVAFGEPYWSHLADTGDFSNSF